MSVRIRATLGVVIGLLVAGGASRARSQPDPAQTPLTLQTAAAEALRANPELRAARDAIDGARGRLFQAGLWPNPELGLGGASDFAFADDGERELSVAVSQPLPIAGRLARSRDVARIEVEIATAEARDLERTLVADVQGSVMTILALDRASAQRRRVIEAVRELTRVSARRFEAAQVSEADLNLLEIDVARLEQERRLVELERATEAVRPNRLLHRPPGTPVELAGDVEEPAFLPPPTTELVAAALARRPDLARLRLEAERARADAKLARAEAWGDWAVEASFDRTRSVIDDAGLDLRDRDELLGLGVRVPVPLFDRNQGRVAEAVAGKRQAEARLAALERAVLAELESTRKRVEELEQVAREYRDMLVPRSERNVELLGRGYREGLSPISDLVQAEQQLADASLGWVRILGELRRAEIDLEAAAASSPLLGLDASQEERP
jgi:cobalt-zinc-cadmium efflux system outer membrane protein